MFAFRQTRRVLLVTIVLAASASGGWAQDADDPGATPDPGAPPAPDVDPAEQKKAAEVQAAFGEAKDTDYLSKHFSVLFGAVILNQFKIEDVPDPSDPTMMATTLGLGDGTADAQAFLEANFRYRWAWLARGSAVSPEGTTVASARRALQSARDALASARAREEAPEASEIEKLEKAVSLRQRDLAEAKQVEEGIEGFLVKEAAAAARVEISERILRRAEGLAADDLTAQQLAAAQAGARADERLAAAESDKFVARVQAKTNTLAAQNLARRAQLDAEASRANAERALLDAQASENDAQIRTAQNALDAAVRTLDESKRASQAQAVLVRAAELAAPTAADVAEAQAFANFAAAQSDALSELEPGAHGGGLTPAARRALEPTTPDARARWRTATSGRMQLAGTAPEALRERRRREVALRYWERNRERSTFMTRKRWTPSFGQSVSAWLVPDNWSARLGYAFGNTGSSAKDVVGASDLYMEVAVGWDAVRWSMPTSSPEEVPVRGSLGIELAGLWFTDKKALDLHGRGLLGFGASFGIPFQFRESSSAPSIVELFFRIGAAYAEIPTFVNDTSRAIEVKNGLPDYRAKWGGGFDMEFNMPITESLGYLALRGSVNMGFDPNPWVISIGYTIPLATLAKGLGVGGG